MFGFDPEELRIEHIDDIGSVFEEDSSDPDACLGLRSALEGRTVKRELVLHSRSNPETLVVAFVATPMRDVGGAVCGAVAVVRDITQQRAMERMKDDFLAIAAHELKTPVTAIKGYAQLAISRLHADAEPARLRRALNTIDQQAERIAHLVEELLDMNRIQAGQLHLQRKWLDLVALAQRSIEQAQQQTSQHQFMLEAPSQIEGCWDEARIEQVLQNLLGNAMKYSPEGGMITTTIALLEDVVHVTVRDQGIGIPPEKQPRIFEPWFQAHTDTSGDYGGMGLGLSICKEIVQRHGGSMWLESKQGKGSLFGFTLPLKAPE
jgi:signal transduction histidine kinase